MYEYIRTAEKFHENFTNSAKAHVVTHSQPTICHMTDVCSK